MSDGRTRHLTVLDLAGVVCSSGKVFDGLATGRLDTENFLRSGSLDGVTSRSDLALREDLRDLAQFVLDSVRTPITAAYVRAVNAKITRSGALHPGQLRTADQGIGVQTRYGCHEPAVLSDTGLQRLFDESIRGDDVLDDALSLFVTLARAQLSLSTGPRRRKNRRRRCRIGIMLSLLPRPRLRRLASTCASRS